MSHSYPDYSSNSYFWQGRKEGETFAGALGRQLMNIKNLQRTLEIPCNGLDLRCENIGSWTAFEGGSTERPLRLLWAFYAMSGLKNLNAELFNRYQALDKSKGDLALEAFNIDDYFPKKGQNFSLQNALMGLGAIFSVVAGFVPVTAVAGALGAAETIASTAAGFASNAVAAQSDPLEAQVCHLLFSLYITHRPSRILIMYR